jgi:CheY-like chemotaxis protein
MLLCSIDGVDVAMPNMSGYELLQRLRNDTTTMMTPFILLSARAGEEANVEGLDLGADDCLVKPFSARELLARVRSSIRLSDLRHELIREQRHALEMKQLIYSISVRIRSGLSLPQILDTASMELFKVIRCNAIRICRFRGTDAETGQHWVRYVAEIAKVGQPKALTPVDRLYPKGLEVSESRVTSGEHEPSSELRTVTNFVHPVYGAKSFISVPLIYNNKIWGYLLASRDADTRDWSQSEKLLFEQTGNQISLAIAHASLWELKKSQQVEMEAAHAANEAKTQILANTSHELRTVSSAFDSHNSKSRKCKSSPGVTILSAAGFVF